MSFLISKYFNFKNHILLLIMDFIRHLSLAIIA
jgi:hypothetical protein